MLIDLGVEGFTESDGVRTVVGRERRAVVLFAEPEVNAIEEVEACPVDQAAAGGLLFGAEEDGRGKKTLQRDTRVIRPCVDQRLSGRKRPLELCPPANVVCAEIDFFHFYL